VPRPLYHELAWAYDLLVEPTGLSADFAADAFEGAGARPGELVVDAGCGTGRLARELAARGARVIGLDRSAELVAEAVRHGGGVEYVVADLTAFRPPEPAAGVLCRGVLNDLLNDAERRDALAALAGMLRPGGALVVDVRDWERSAERYADGRSVERSATGPDGTEVAFTSTTRIDAKARHLVSIERVAVGVGELGHEMRMRPWTREELDAGLRTAGFEDVRLVAPEEAGARSDRIVAVATR
jgi:SAM-dependent methyltransferase